MAQTAVTVTIWLAILLISSTPFAASLSANSPESLVEHGEYMVHIAGCANCHTENNDEPFAGGKELKTGFGTFYSPNITPDLESGIGNWSEADFIRALQQGLSPKGEHYYPAFPYTSYSKMSMDDMLAIKAYLNSLTPIKKHNKPHIIAWPGSDRGMLGFWKSLNFEPGSYRTHPGKSSLWNRGAYLVDAVTHCGECHTPRYSSGGAMKNRYLSGAPKGSNAFPTPNITRHNKDGIGHWSKPQVMAFLVSGMTPDARKVRGDMHKVIEESTSKLNNHDLNAMAEYLITIPPIPTFRDYRDLNNLWRNDNAR